MKIQYALVLAILLISCNSLNSGLKREYSITEGRFDGIYIEKGFSLRGMIDVDFYVMFSRSKMFINEKNG